MKTTKTRILKYTVTIFITYGVTEAPALPIPETVIQRVKEIVSGVMFLTNNPTKGVLTLDEENDSTGLGIPAISITTVFGEDLRVDRDDTPRISTCLLAFEVSDPHYAPTGVAVAFQKNLFGTVFTSKFDDFPASQIYGDFFTFLADRRVGFSQEAVRAYSLVKDYGSAGLATVPREDFRGNLPRVHDEHKEPSLRSGKERRRR